MTHADFSAAVKQGAANGRLAGTVISKQERKTKTGNKMGIIVFSDSSGQFESVLFSEMLNQYRDILEPGKSFVITATGEAAMNAAVHAGDGEGRVYLDRVAGKVQVWIIDTGGGIAEQHLHKATLRRGFSLAGTLGHGFWLMLHTVDRLWLLTSAGGTTVVLEHGREPPAQE